MWWGDDCCALLLFIFCLCFLSCLQILFLFARSLFFSLSACLLRGHRSYAMRGHLWLKLIVKNNLLSGHASLLSAECFVSKIYLELWQVFRKAHIHAWRHIREFKTRSLKRDAFYTISIIWIIVRSCEVKDKSSLFQKMVKISCLFLLVLIALSCESKKKGKKKASSGHVPSWLRTPAPKPTPSSASGVSYKVGCIIQVSMLTVYSRLLVSGVNTSRKWNIRGEPFSNFTLHGNCAVQFENCGIHSAIGDVQACCESSGSLV